MRKNALGAKVASVVGATGSLVAQYDTPSVRPTPVKTPIFTKARRDGFPLLLLPSVELPRSEVTLYSRDHRDQVKLAELVFLPPCGLPV
jgi:hypothetical protein|tara:strand:+ start:127 stop:393 length:267 start_codon:yes stop_codon:yes gene_type:complete